MDMKDKWWTNYWWEFLSDEKLKFLSKKFPDYQKLEYPTKEIRWLLQSLDFNPIYLTEEEFENHIAFCRAYKAKYGVRYKGEPFLTEIDEQRDKEFREEYYKNKSKP